MTNEMKKIVQLSQKQFEALKRSNHPDKLFKKYVGVDQAEYALGDTAVMISNPELYGIYRYEWKAKIVYYLIVNVMGPDLAFAWSLYPMREVSVSA